MAADLSIASLDSFRVGSFQSPELQSGFSPLVASQVQLSGMDGLNHLDVDRELTNQADSFVKQSGRLFSPEDEIRNLQSKIPSKSVLQGALFGSELSEKAAFAQLDEQESQDSEKNSSAQITEVDAKLAFDFGFQNYAGLFAPKSNTLNEKDILRLSSLSAIGTTDESREFRIGSHCNAFGRVRSLNFSRREKDPILICLCQRSISRRCMLHPIQEIYEILRRLIHHRLVPWDSVVASLLIH
jgi:hypothetical protein